MSRKRLLMSSLVLLGLRMVVHATDVPFDGAPTIDAVPTKKFPGLVGLRNVTGKGGSGGSGGRGAGLGKVSLLTEEEVWYGYCETPPCSADLDPCVFDGPDCYKFFADDFHVASLCDKFLYKINVALFCADGFQVWPIITETHGPEDCCKVFYPRKACQDLRDLYETNAWINYLGCPHRPCGFDNNDYYNKAAAILKACDPTCCETCQD